MLAFALICSTLSSAQASDKPIRFRVEPLTISEEINAVDLFRNGFIAVGEGGLVIVVYEDGYRIVERKAPGNLKDVSCSDRYCIAVGRKGVSLMYDNVRKVFKKLSLPAEDYFKVVNHGDVFYIAYPKGIIIYSLNYGSVQTILLEVMDLEVHGDKIVILRKDLLKILDLEGRELETISLKNVKSPKKIQYINGTLWVLGENLYKFNGTGFEKSLDLACDSVQYDGSIFLLSKGSIYKWVLNGLELIVSLENVKDMKARDGRIIIVGKGYLAEYEKELRYLFTPSTKYTSSASDRSRAVIVGKDNTILLYESGYFRTIQAPPDDYVSASIEGDRILLLRSKNIVEVRDGFMKTFPYKGGDYTSIYLYLGRVLLTSGRGLFEIDLETYNVKHLVEASLSKVTRYGAVGKEVLIVPNISGYEKVKINFTAIDVSGAGCTIIAVGEKGLAIIYREGKIEYFKASKDPLTAVGLNRKYGLIGDSKGNLYIFDGYDISPLIYSLGEEVKSISWIDGREALIITSNNIYRFIEEYYPEPSLELLSSKHIRVYNGSETKVRMLLKPLSGYSGEIKLTPRIEFDGVYARIEPGEVYVREMCPVEVSLKIYSESWAKGRGRLEIIYDGFREEVDIIVEAKIPKKEESRSIFSDTLILYTILSSVILSCLAAAFKMKKWKKEKKTQPASREVEVEEW